MKGKRSSTDRIKHQSRHQAGVGARHRQMNVATGGVGYLDVYTKIESSIQKKRASDPRITQLKKMGMDWRWIRIAQQIGFDAFIQTWALISDMFEDDRPYVRASIPHVKKLIRYQRNILIRRLHASGHNVRHIQDVIEKTYMISMSRRAIRDVLHVK